MNHRGVVGFVIAAGALCVGVAAPAEAVPRLPAEGTVAAVEAYLDAAHADLRLDGLSVVVLKDGRPWVERAYGDVESGPVTVDTAFRLGSTSKQLTGLMVQSLVADGRLRLDDRLGDLLPEFRAPTDQRAAGVTVRNLLAHTSGWSTDAGLDQWGWRLSRPASIRGEAAALAATPLAAAPGAGYAYTNAGYDLLGAVVEDVTGRSYAAALDELVVRPLGLTGTTGDLGVADRTGVADDTYTWFGALTVRTATPHPAGAVPSSYVTSSAADLAKVVAAHLGSQDGVPATVLEATRRPLTRVSEYAEYASGWFVRPLWELHDRAADPLAADLPRCVTHEGTTPRSMTALLACPGNGFGVVALTNTAAGPDPARWSRFFAGLTHAALGTEPLPAGSPWLVANASWVMVAVPVVQLVLLTGLVRSRRGRARSLLGRWLLGAVAVGVSTAAIYLAWVYAPGSTGQATPLPVLWDATPDLAVVTFVGTVLAAATVVLAVRRTRDP